MAATTTETWVADGLLLNTHAYNISTHTGRSGLPPIRGENDPTPLRGGRNWTPKVWDERKLLLEMWIQGNDPDGVVPTSHTQRAEFNHNLRTLKQVFGERSRLIELVRQVDLPDGLLELKGYIECIGTMEPTTSNSGTLGVMTVECIMPDPFWYGNTEVFILNGPEDTLENPGDTTVEKMEITLTGPLVNPMVYNDTLGISLRYHGTIGAGASVLINTGKFTAVDNLNNNRIAYLSNIGSNWWMNLRRGENKLTLSNWQGGSVGEGSVSFSYLPPYL